MISAIIPVHNAPSAFLNECLESIAAQKHSPTVELLLVDDASSSTHQVEYEKAVKHLSRPSFLKHVEVIRSPENLGIPAARNLGVQRSTGEVIVFVDDDDYVEPDAFALVAGALEAGAGFVYTDHMDCGNDLEDVLRIRRKHTWQLLYDLYAGTVWDPFLHATFLIHMHAIRREVFIELGGWNETIVYGDEPEFHLRFSQSCFARQLAHVPEVCYRHRTNPWGATSDEATLSRLLRNIEAVFLQKIHERGLTSVVECQRLGRCKRTLTGVFAYRDSNGSLVSAPYLDPKVPALRWTAS